jgi:DNA sulfur modification protein DndD
VPVLQNARKDIHALLGEANRQVGRAAEGDNRTRQIGLSLQNTQDELDTKQENASQLQRRIAGLESEREQLEAQLAGTQRTQRLFGERDQLKEAKQRQTKALEEVKVEIQDLSATAWRAVLAPQLRQVVGRLDQEIDHTTERRNKALVASELQAALAAAQKTGTCPTCGTHLEPGALPGPNDPAPTEDLDQIETALSDLRQRRATLRTVAAQDPTEKLAAAYERLENAEVALADIEADLEAVQEKLRSYEGTESDLRHLAQRYAFVGQTLSTARSALEEEQTEIERRESVIERLKAQLQRIDSSGREGAERRAALLGQMEELFTEGIARYREQLRVDVEREATKTFCELRQEPDFVGLRINDSYGLEIMHRDGTTIGRRSAGQEHIVALSLIAGLQRCAPISGPIIMDSPFGRLDDDHTRNVVRALPTMAQQVVVLVYDTELDRQTAIEELDGSLRSELQLDRVNARHTVIEPRSH